ncbi:MAG: hypothetical protein H6698_08335 [Myxococcales bacterium]|nr:hypothetical protein [Myxococcales bacterium]MCB9520158.1 hypothetical protein [Myxococcales bacterium]MCB9531220.1 hypothetical protein [Myxococcales bacterium]MCB9534297.1 hypothetical protein [Myxococcales bacterium]
MRGSAVVAGRSTEQLRAMAQRLRSEGADAASLLAAMRAPDAFDRVERLCTTPLMLEDLVLLCANPFDAVAAEELADAAAFEAAGVIARSAAGDFRVNLDIALSAAPSAPIEFGFAATLIARLAAEERVALLRALEVGPRPTVVDAVLDGAAALRDESALMRTVARLTVSDREIVTEAIGLGELPDDISAFPLDAGPPMVTLDPGAAGRRGLVFWVEHEASGLEARPVVPLELLERLAGVLERVPPPPEVKSAPAPRRRTAAPAARPKRRVELLSDSDSTSETKSLPAAAPGPQREPPSGSGPTRGLRESPSGSGTMRGLRDAPGGSGPLSALRDPLAGSGASAASRDPLAGSAPTRKFSGDPLAASGAAGVEPGERVRARPAPGTVGGAMASPWVGRVSSIRAASALVDMGSSRAADAAAKDEELSAGILEVASEGWLVLRPEVDAADWAERAALRLSL